MFGRVGRWLKKYRKPCLFFLLFLALVVLFVSRDLRQQFTLWFKSTASPWLRSHPFLAPGVYILLYFVAVVAFMPGSVITLAGGAIFGPLAGTIYVSVASTLAAGAAFLIARYFAAGWVEARASGRLGKLKSGIEAEGWRFVAFTRLVPIFPYNLLNYMFGLTRINFWVYLFVSWLCMLPGTFAYVYAGYVGRQVALGQGGTIGLLLKISLAAGLIILATMVPRWLRRWRSSGEADPAS